MKHNDWSSRWPVTLAVSFFAVLLFAGASIAVAALTFSGTTISGDSGVLVDSSSTISIGASSATGITIGRSGITATFPGTVTITGTTTTLQNLVVSGNCVGCGIGNFTAGGDLAGSSTSQTVIGIQGRAVSSTAPSTNQVLTWNGSFWTPANVSSTGGSGITAINGLSNVTTTILGTGTVTVSTSSPNIITITGTGSGAITIDSLTTSTLQILGTANQITVTTSSPNILSLSLPQNIGTTSIPTFGGLTLNGNATTTSLTISGLASAGSPCLSVGLTGALATTTCATGGSVTSSSIASAGGLLSANNLADLLSTSSARIALGLNNLYNALQLIAANNLSDLTNTSTARMNLGFTGGTGITISGAGAVGLATTSISQFVNNVGYVTSTGAGVTGGQNGFLPLWTGSSTLSTSTLQAATSSIVTTGGLAVGTTTNQAAGNLLVTGNATTAGSLSASGTVSVGGPLLTNPEYNNGICTTSATISPANGNRQRITLTNSQTCALTFVQPSSGTASIQLKVIQSATSSYNGTISGGKWPGGTVPTITATSGAVDIVTCYLDGTNAYCVATQNFE